MELHHSKHHAAYVNGLNASKEQLHSAMQSGACGVSECMAHNSN